MVEILRVLAVVAMLVTMGVLLWLAWKIAVFLFVAWIMIGVASSAMKGSS